MLSKHTLRNPQYLLGRRIQYIREKKGFTQEMLAQAIGTSTSYIGNIETGKHGPSLKRLCKIANTLHVKVADLFPF